MRLPAFVSAGARKRNRSTNDLGDDERCMRALPPQLGSGGVQKRGGTWSGISQLPIFRSFASPSRTA